MSASMLRSIRADVARFREEGPGLRPMIRGMLSQGFQALLVYRVFRWFHERGIPTQPVRFVVERLIEITTGICIPVRARIGPGLRICHFGGIVLHPAAVIGEGCTIFHGVTLGDEGLSGGAPRIGDRVMIGAGAKVLGSIEVGDDCLIGTHVMVMDTDFHRVEDKAWDTTGEPIVIEDRVWLGNRSIVLKGVTVGHDAVVAAGSVVTKDVPPRCVVAGVPAKVVRRF